MAKGELDTKRTGIKPIEVDKEKGDGILLLNKLHSRTNNL